MKMRIDIIIPSFRSEGLTTAAIKSFEKNKSTFNFRYIVVENSDDTSYKDKVEALNDNVLWVQNPTHLTNSYANAIAIERGLEHVQSELVFICHNDVAAVDPSWMHFLVSKINEGNKLVGTVLDNIRINAVHISGLLTYTEIAKQVDIYPVQRDNKQVLDVGDSLTQYCSEREISFYCCRNTENNSVSPHELDEKYSSFNVDRAVDDTGKVIFMHLGRGTHKNFGLYHKPSKILLGDWLSFLGEP